MGYGRLKDAMSHNEDLARANRELQRMVGQKAGALREAEDRIADLLDKVEELEDYCEVLEDERDQLKDDRDMHQRLHDASESRVTELSGKVWDLQEEIDQREK